MTAQARPRRNAALAGTFLPQHLHAHGGTGYDHVRGGVVPALRARGFSEDDVRTLLVDNPRRALTGRAG